MVKMSKAEFVSRYINDRYNKELKERRIRDQPDNYIFENIQRINDHKRRSKKCPIKSKEF